MRGSGTAEGGARSPHTPSGLHGSIPAGRGWLERCGCVREPAHERRARQALADQEGVVAERFEQLRETLGHARVPHHPCDFALEHLLGDGWAPIQVGTDLAFEHGSRGGLLEGHGASDAVGMAHALERLLRADPLFEAELLCESGARGEGQAEEQGARSLPWHHRFPSQRRRLYRGPASANALYKGMESTSEEDPLGAAVRARRWHIACCFGHRTSAESIGDRTRRTP